MHYVFSPDTQSVAVNLATNNIDNSINHTQARTHGLGIFRDLNEHNFIRCQNLFSKRLNYGYRVTMKTNITGNITTLNLNYTIIYACI